MFLILPAALGSGVYSVSNRNEYQKHKNIMFLGSKVRRVRRPPRPVTGIALLFTFTEHNVSTTGSVSVLNWREIPTLFGLLETANLNHWDDEERSSFRNVVFSSAIVRLEELGKLKKCDVLVGIRTPDLSAYSIAPQASTVSLT
jgi:hypothetical protein